MFSRLWISRSVWPAFKASCTFGQKARSGAISLRGILPSERFDRGHRGLSDELCSPYIQQPRNGFLDNSLREILKTPR
jgi:hypothetical protein